MSQVNQPLGLLSTTIKEEIFQSTTEKDGESGGGSRVWRAESGGRCRVRRNRQRY